MLTITFTILTMFTTVFIHPWGVAFPTTNVVVTSLMRLLLRTIS